MTQETSHIEPEDSTCPFCGHEENRTVDTKIEGRGSTRTLAIKECCNCQTLWGEPKEWYGVIDTKRESE